MTPRPLGLGELVGLVPAGAAPAVPGTRPSTLSAASAAATGGLQLVVNERGHLSRSIGGVTSEDTAGGTVTARKPAGATVRKAFLAVATTGFSGSPLSIPVTLDGRPVALENRTASGIGSYNYVTDVTTLVSGRLNAAAAGPVSFTVAEPEPALTEGEVLVVVFDDPAVTADQTVSILFGALSPTGDEYGIDLASPISLTDPATRLEMSLGISYSCEDPAECGSAGQQFSDVDVNGRRLTSAAGGEDDGHPANGALLTVGGEGDSPANPADADAGPVSARSDDELYDLRPFVRSGDKHISVTTVNPSLDDNVFLAVFAMNPPVTGVSTTPPPTEQNLPPIFTERPAGTVFPGDGDIRIAATDPEGQPVTIRWSLLPLQPVRVTCADTANPAAPAVVTCRLTPRSGIDTTNTITFTATDPGGAVATTTVTVGPAYYLGMGDSYASGEGNPPFDRGTDRPSNFPFNSVAGSCHRSPASWERFLDVHTAYALQAHIACSGAKAADLLAPTFKGERGQVAQLRSLAHKPNLITLTVGGNDSFFGPVLGACWLADRMGACGPALVAMNFQIAHLRPQLVALYDAIHAAAPQARIVVVGYPNIIGTGLTAPLRCPTVTPASLLLLKASATNLDNAVRAAVSSVAAADRLSYVSTLDVLRGHELCTGDAWVNAVHLDAVAAATGKFADSAHPNAPGQRAIEARVAAVINSL